MNLLLIYNIFIDNCYYVCSFGNIYFRQILFKDKII